MAVIVQQSRTSDNRIGTRRPSADQRLGQSSFSLILPAKNGVVSVFPGVEKTRGVCGGRACIVRTRIPVWSIIQWQRKGLSQMKILKNFPTLVKSDILAANLYYNHFTAEIDHDIAENTLDNDE
jgi:uncharacterized protein (DUF433 family)